MLVAMFVIAVAHDSSGLELVITPRGQNGDATCWAACCEMILDAYDDYVTQSTIVNWAVGGQDVGNELTGRPTAVDMVLEHFGDIECNHTGPNLDGYGNISKDDLTWEIDRGRPAIASWMYPDAPDPEDCTKHSLLIIGYTGSGGSDVGDVIFNDPVDGGSRRQRSYAEFVRRGNEYAWRETLRLTSNPLVPIPTPIGGGDENVVIYEEESTAEITESTHSLTYSAGKSGQYTPTCWRWKLVFPHSSGYAVVASWSPTVSDWITTWNVENFTMPTGFDWKYNFDGKIPGRVEVEVDDESGSPSCWNSMDVLYIPDELYPGVLIYEEQTISGPEPVVKAHERLIVRDDQFLAGADISLKSGERLDVEGGVTISKGAIVDFVVDPSLR